MENIYIAWDIIDSLIQLAGVLMLASIARTLALPHQKRPTTTPTPTRIIHY